jgi:hypothetical protein
MLYVRYVHSTKASHIHKRGTHFLARKILRKDYGRKCLVAKKVSGRDTQETWRQDELISGKL